MTAEVKTVITAVDGTSAVMAKVNGQYVSLNSQLAQIGRQTQANDVLAAAKEKFNQLTQAERDAIVAADDNEQAQAALRAQMGESEGAVESFKGGMEELNQGLEVGRKAIELIKKGYEATIGKFEDYAAEVQKVSAISGASSEDTSRFIQVLSKYGVTVGDIEAATKKLTSQGLAPNRDTIVDLAKKYQSLNDPVAKNELLFKNLGRAGEDYNKILSMNTDELAKNFDEVKAGLVLSEKQLAQAEQLRVSNEELSKSEEAFGVTVGSVLAPRMQAWVDLLNKAATGQVDWGKAMSDAYSGKSLGIFTAYGDQFNANEASLQKLTQAQKENTISTKDQAAADQAAADAKNAATTANQNFISTLSSVASSEKTYTASYAKDEADRIAIMKHVDKLRAQGYSYYGETIQGEIQKVRDIGQKERELAAERQVHNNEFILAQELQILSVDGLTDKELAAYLAQGKAFGLFTQDYIDKTTLILGAARDLAAGIDKTPTHKVVTFDIINHKEQVTDVADAIADVPAKKTVEIVVNTTYTGGGTASPKQLDMPKASGGPVYAGQSLWVGENGPERFVPTENGTIVPANKTRDYLPAGGFSQNDSAQPPASQGDIYNFNAYGTFAQGSNDLEQQFLTMLRKAQANGLVPVGGR